MFCAFALTGAGPGLAAQDDAPLVRAFEIYASGDYDGVVRSLASRQAYAIALRDLDRVMGVWRRDWRPRRIAFLVEAGIIGVRREFPEAEQFLFAARDLTTARVARPGQSPEQDAFEIMVHRAAIAVFEGSGRLTDIDTYLKSISKRVVPVRGESTILDPRIALAQAFVNEMRLRPADIVARSGPETPSLVTAVRDNRARDHVRAAIAALDTAAEHAETAPEAALHRAYLVIRLGRPQEAVDLLDVTRTTMATDELRYLSHLFSGRALVALQQPTSAITQFEAAARVLPDAQTPAVALTSLLVQAGRRDEARQWAEVARTRRGIDPWWLYWTGDYRLLPRWVGELRKAS